LIKERITKYYLFLYSWIVIIKHDTSVAGKPDLKVKSLIRKEDTDIRSGELLTYLRAEIRERDQRENTALANRSSRLYASSAASGSEAISTPANNNVHVLVGVHRSKKTNKWSVIESAQQRSRELLNSYMNAPVAAIETKDEVMDMIRETRLSDPDGWRKVIQSVRLEERQYLQDVHALLLKFERWWRENGKPSEGRIAFVYNFRTQGCLIYDLGL
jgi:eukaryotic translation initiation factor 2-alpha kinase 4